MTTDLTTYQAQPSGLALRPDQTAFTDQQRAVLAHMGAGDAPEADLAVYAHVCQRSGLDPFARQIHMIGRTSNVNEGGQWRSVTKYTIQTGIDGYRLIGRRAADARGVTISLDPPEWAHEDGSWRPVWSRAWGLPIAARVTIRRGGEPFTAVAMFDEYRQAKRDGTLTSMWAQRPAGQLAKCAEALAWRMAFPQDLSGIYVDDEMHHADSEQAVAEPRKGGVAGLRAAVMPTESDDIEAAEEVAEVVPEPITAGQSKKLHALLRECGLDRPAALAWFTERCAREITSSKDLTKDETSGLIDALGAATTEADTLPVGGEDRG